MAGKPKLVARIEAEDSAKRLAVLIDSDNARAAVIEAVLEEVASFGEAIVKRIYGDFTASTSAQWKKVLAKFAIKPVQQFAYTTGKNATDSTMIIDAMDLLHTGRFDGFCLVSSDSDFTGLAIRIREQGVTVYGFGEEKTPAAFRKACNKFVCVENLVAAAGQTVDTAASPREEPPGKKKTPIPQETVERASQATKDIPFEFFSQALEKAGDDSGWAHLGTFGAFLTKLRPDFDSRNYGFKKLSDLVKAKKDFFEIEERKAPSSSMKDLYIRIRTR